MTKFFRGCRLSSLFIFSLLAAASHPSLRAASLQALAPSCELRTLEASLPVPTKDLRHGEEYLRRLDLFYERNGHLPEPVKVAVFEDGRYFVLDGHHGFEVLRRRQVNPLRVDRDFTLVKLRYADLSKINHVSDWRTPFDPRLQIRLADLRSYDEFVSRLAQVLGPNELNAFIRQHPEAYSVARDAPKMAQVYEGVARDREAYFRRMDKSMAMKVGQLVGAVPADGILWEPGTGSGAQAAAYAAYYPRLLVLGTDLDQKSVRFAQERFAFPNLIYFQGDALNPDLPSSFVDAVEDSSSGHHFVSYGRTGRDFREENIEEYRAHVSRILKPGGYYAMRDFVAPEWPKRVRIVLSRAPGSAKGYGAFSKADLFAHFAKNFKSHDYDPARDLVKELTATSSDRSFEAPGEMVANFLLRIDYTENWEAELKEQYTYYNQGEHSASLLRHGMRVDFSLAYRNPWIEKQWWPQSVARVFALDGSPLDLPPTNLILYARKLRPFDVKEITLESAAPITGDSWMRFKKFRSPLGGESRDLITVPGVTKSFLPYESNHEGHFIFVVREALNPALVYYSRLSGFDGAQYSGLTSDSFTKVVATGDKSSFQQVFAQVLEEKASTTLANDTAQAIRVEKGHSFLPSPGASDELVEMNLVDMGEHGSSNVFAHSSAKRIEVRQFIAATNMGSIPDGRLQVAAYKLARRKGWDGGPWSGGNLTQWERSSAALLGAYPYSYARLTAAMPKAEWVEDSTVSEPYLTLESLRLREHRANGESRDFSFESARPAKESVNTVSTIPYCFAEGELFIGFETYSSPSFESRGLTPTQYVVPAFRLSVGVKDRLALQSEIKAKWGKTFGVNPELQNLGEGYFPSPGQSPEKVFPFAVDVGRETEKIKGLRFVPWSHLKNELDAIPDLHTLVAIYRLAHAFGI